MGAVLMEVTMRPTLSGKPTATRLKKRRSRSRRKRREDPVNFYRAGHERKHSKRVVAKKPRSGPLTQADMDSLFCTWDDLLFETPSASYQYVRLLET